MELKSNAGLSLMSVMVVIALLGILTVVVNTMVKNASIGQQSLELQMDRAAIRRLV